MLSNTTPLAEQSLYLSFFNALQEEQTADVDYDRSKWLHLPCRDTDYRYILGTKGNNPLICIGINPSTARPEHTDNTMRRVQKIAVSNGFDSVLMCNVYAKRSKSPDKLETVCDSALHTENLKAIEWVLNYVGENPTVWAAWGNSIDSREYLTDCLRDIVKLTERFGVRWYTAGSRSKAKGHPHHPLYLNGNSKLCPFDDIGEYIDNL